MKNKKTYKKHRIIIEIERLYIKNKKITINKNKRKNQ